MATLAATFGRGLLADRPAAGVIGRHYVTTDETPDTMYRDNGASWDVVAYASFGTGVAEDLTTAETDTTKRLAPDGVGGVQFVAGGGGGGTPAEQAASKIYAYLSFR